MVGTAKDLSLAKALGVVLRRLRQTAKLSQEDLALEAGLQRNFVSLIERGENQPTITTIGRLATALRISASGLVAAAEEFLETPKQPRRATPPRRSAKALQSSLDRDASSNEPGGKSVTRIRKSAKGGLT